MHSVDDPLSLTQVIKPLTIPGVLAVKCESLLCTGRQWQWQEGKGSFDTIRIANGHGRELSSS
jgi:hypothetical protein